MTESRNKLGSIVGKGTKGLWVASTGGHLEQLVRISNLSTYREDSIWVTFDNQQSRSLLAHRRTIHVSYVKPRDLYRAVRAVWKVIPILRTESFDFCVSTGAALATFILPMSRIFGARAIYIESVSRTDGPSLTGRIMAAVPGVETYTQHARWASRKWRYSGSLLDNWTVKQDENVDRPLTIFVTLGTIKPYRFDRAVRAIVRSIKPSDVVTWQLGTSWRDGLPGTTYKEMTADEVKANIEKSDVVVTHAGVGSVINILDAGSLPVVAVRTKDHKEHIDNHQRQIASMMAERGLAEVLDLDHPNRNTLLTAASKRVERRQDG
ncbi:hypothetical protein CH263_24540 [Rhodococcus sp. 06-1059B-a]|nr:glycosyltransferase [Rhodococcus sp. 06-1059B-a]OZD58431.1 hypothetical protein CH263_24540 [Rhodococcus sp. 06-1059B-a]